MDILNDFKKLAEEKIGELFGLIKESLSEKPTEVSENLKFLLADSVDQLQFEPIGIDDGIINYIYRISTADRSQSVVLKWGRETLKVQEVCDLGIKEHEYSEFPHRNYVEARALETINEFVPGSTADIYWIDENRHFFIMEDLVGYVTLKQQLEAGVVLEQVFLGIARFLSKLHTSTHCTVISEARKQEMIIMFNSDAGFGGLTMDYLYMEAFRSDNPAAKVRPRSPYLEKVLPEIIDDREIEACKAMMMRAMKDKMVSFTHNDTHPGFVMIDQQHMNLKYIDGEVAKYGFPAKDVGYFLGEVIVWYYVNLGRGRTDVCKHIQEYVGKMMEDYVSGMGDYIGDFQEFLHYMTAHAGHFAALRTVNLMRFPQFEGLEEAEAKCTQVATVLMKQCKSVNTMDDFSGHAFTLNLSLT